MVARARERGVDAIVTVGCDVEDSLRACEVAERFDLAATIGIHPHEAKDAPADLPAALDALRERFGSRVVAVGETGLDYHYDHSPRDVQRSVFAAQLAYARARNLPLVFHQREAHDDFVAGLRAGYDPRSQRGVVHCFTGTPAEARVFANEFGLMLGIGGVVTFKTAQPLRDAVRRSDSTRSCSRPTVRTSRRSRIVGNATRSPTSPIPRASSPKCSASTSRPSLRARTPTRARCSNWRRRPRRAATRPTSAQSGRAARPRSPDP